MDRVRCLTEYGIAEFQEYLVRLRENGSIPPPRHLLTDSSGSRQVNTANVFIEPKDFANRREFAEYIDDRFVSSGCDDEVNEAGLWEWLSLYYFDSVCPSNVDGLRRPGSSSRHIIGSGIGAKVQRHLLRNSYLIYRVYRRFSDVPLDLLLGGRLHEYSKAVTQIGERRRIFNSKSVLVAANRLYLDTAVGRPKRGYATGDASIQAFGRIVNNLPARYDLETVSADTILALLPDEFRIWLDDNLEDDDELSEIRETFSSVRSTINEEVEFPPPESIDQLLRSMENRALSHRIANVRSSFFRDGVLSAYGSRCAVSGLALTHASGESEEKPEVQAAHIIPVAFGGSDVIQNGLALNRTVHWAFDLGMLWVNQDYKVSVSRDVVHDSRNAWLLAMSGNPLKLPDNHNLHPAQRALRWHATNIARRWN